MARPFPSSSAGPLMRWSRVARLVVVCLAVGPARLVSQAAPLVGVNVGDSARIVVAPGTKFSVPVFGAPAGGANVASLTAGLTWIATVIGLDSVRAGTFGALTANTTNAPSGQATLGIANATGTTTTASIAMMYFTAAATTGGTRLNITPTLAGNELGASILSQLVPRPLDVCVAPSARWGDVNGDDATNIIDAQQIARFSVGLAVGNPSALAAQGDVNADGTVNIIDAQQIARFSVALSAATRVNTLHATLPLAGSVTLSPANPTIAVADTLRLTGTVLDGASAPITGCATVSYTSSDTTRVRVNAAGLVTAVAPGSATVTATADGKSAQATVTVRVSLGTVPAFLRYVRGDSQVVAGTREMTYAPAVRVVDAQDRPVFGVPVTFKGSGAMLRAVSGGAASATLVVNSDSSGLAAPGAWYIDAAILYPPVNAFGTVTATSGALNSILFTAATSDAHSAATGCALTSTGTPYCWGEYESLMLNNFSADTTLGKFPVQVPGGVALASLPRTINGEFQCGLTAAGAAYCWGWNGAGQLGDGTFDNSAAMRAVAGGLSFSQMTTGLLHACGLTSSGAAWCWGLNADGTLGDPSTYSSASRVPVPVSGGLAFSTLSAGNTATCGVATNGDTWCWGRGSGIDSSAGNHATPHKVPFVPSFKDIAVANGAICGLTPAGAAYCWGENAYGQLGDGSLTTRWTSAQPVAGGQTFTQIYGVGFYFCGRTATDQLHCWGRNEAGQLGVGDLTSRPTPTSTGLTVTTGQVMTGGACFKVPDGVPWCWGSRALGDGVYTLTNGLPKTTPGPVQWAQAETGVTASLLVHAGDGQSALIGGALPQPLMVKVVSDAAGTPAPGVAVTWSVGSGGGSLSRSVDTTGADGLSSASWTLGRKVGPQTATATVGGLSGSPVVFGATATAAAGSTTYYVSPSGSDEADGLSRATAWRTLSYSLSWVQPGDVLLVLDGTYSDSIVTARSGTATNPVVIRAEHDGGAVIDGAWTTVPVQMNHDYVQFEGFTVKRGLESNIVVSGNNNKVLRVGAMSVTSGEFAFNISITGTGNLLEDVFVWGGFRTGIELGTRGNTVRRCLVKNDASVATAGDWPPFGVRSYNNSGLAGALVENCIVIDFNPTVSFGQDRPGAAFRVRSFDPADDSHFYGNIALDVKSNTGILHGWWLEGRLHTLKDNVAWNGDYVAYQNDGQYNLDSSVVATNVTGSGWSAFTNSSSANITFVNEKDGASGMTYITRPDSSGRGATIEKRYVNGVLTSDPLWPWPNEARIRNEICQYEIAPDYFAAAPPNRGFCASGKSLTKYIWEYLGNASPY